MNFMSLLPRVEDIRSIHIEKKGYSHYDLISSYTDHPDIKIVNDVLLTDDTIPFVSINFELLVLKPKEKWWEEDKEVITRIQIVDLSEEAVYNRLVEYLDEHEATK